MSSNDNKNAGKTQDEGQEDERNGGYRLMLDSSNYSINDFRPVSCSQVLQRMT